MKTHKLLLVAIMLLLTTAIGCKKEKGCTDSSATNFNSSAEEDDGSCSFQGKQVFWYNNSTATFLVGDGATALTFYVDGQVVGSCATSVYWASAPSCDAGGSITVTKNLGSSKTKSFSYSVKDQTGWEYWGGTISFNANTCTSSQLN